MDKKKLRGGAYLKIDSCKNKWCALALDISIREDII